MKSVAEILERSTEPNSDGEVVDPWVVIGQRPCEVLYLGGSESAQESGELTLSSVRIRMRYDLLSRTITAAHRLRIDGVVYDISAPPMNRGRSNKMIEILADVNGRQQ